MGQNFSNEDAASAVIDLCNQPITITLDVEDGVLFNRQPPERLAALHRGYASVPSLQCETRCREALQDRRVYGLPRASCG